MANIVNVLLHGIFGYVLAEDYIYAYTPCVCGHIYETSTGSAERVGRPFARGDYALEGVKRGSRFQFDRTQYPQVPLALDNKHKIDEFSKRYSVFRLPYPRSADDVHALDIFRVGSIYSGRDSAPLNGDGLCKDCVGQIASLHAFVYETTSDALQLTPFGMKGSRSLGIKPISIAETSKTSEHHAIINFHIWCTTPPMDRDLHGYTAEGHLRRGFAALIDMFPRIEITIEIPNNFTPQSVPDRLPQGVTGCDVDPGRDGCTHFGHVNCHYANVLFLPTRGAAHK